MAPHRLARLVAAVREVAPLARLVAAALDVALPPRCLGCGARDAWVCPDCAAGLPRLPRQRCQVCAAPLRGVAVCPACYRRPPPFDRVDAPFRYDGLARDLVRGLKYHDQRHLAPILAGAMAGALTDGTVDLVVPVPLHPTRRAERGFNQSELLAIHVAARLGLRCDPAALRRERPTRPQVELARAERAANVRGAFAASGRLDGRRALLVDDVYTTGATLSACAAALKQAGVVQVTCLVATRASAIDL